VRFRHMSVPPCRTSFVIPLVLALASYVATGKGMAQTANPARKPVPQPAKTVAPKIVKATTTKPRITIRGTCYNTHQTPYTFLTPGSDAQLKRLKETGMNMISLRVEWGQEGSNTWDIVPNYSTPTDEAVEHVVQVCHDLGMQVTISLMVTFSTYSGPSNWWGEIKPGADMKDAAGNPLNIDENEGWRRWFESYEKFLLHYARLSEKCGAEVLGVGNEFVTASKREAQWRHLIAKTREVYKGKLLYQAITPEFKDVKFWDALDYIGLNSYWELSTKPNPTSAELEVGLLKARDELQTWYDGLDARSRKPILFTETGYYSADGTAIHPWESNTVNRVRIANPELQARCIEAFLKIFGNEPTSAGIFWWVECPPGEYGVDHAGAGFPFLGKPAEAVLKRFALEQEAKSGQ
jgi:hypothetical protein